MWFSTNNKELFNSYVVGNSLPIYDFGSYPITYYIADYNTAKKDCRLELSSSTAAA
jgi:hypothetical protein